MRAYVQAVQKDAPVYLSCLQAAHWFWERGYEVIPFEFDDIGKGLLDDDLLLHPEEVVVRGGVEAVRQLLVRVGRPVPPNIDLPPSLSRWIGRRVWQTTLDAVRTLVDSEHFEPIHVKPLLHHKLFKGTVIRAFRDLIPSAAIAGDTPVLAQEYVNFISEWRVTILRDKVLNVAHYLGDPLAFPDVAALRLAVTAFEGRPIGFGMDWGVTGTGQSLLVEVNDGYSLGNYGLRGRQFTALVEASWRQLMGLSDKGVDA